MKNHICKIVLIFLLTSQFEFSFAQKEIVSQQNAWYMYFGNHRISDRWGIHTEYQFRRHEWGQEWQQSLLRVGADYYTKGGAQLTAGYGWIKSFPYGKQPISYAFNEHRIWQQLILTQQTGRFYFHHRYRLEQRFLERKVLVDPHWSIYEHSEYVFRQRARYRFMVSYPINHTTMVDKTFFLSIYDEPFLGFGKGIQKNVMDQNRLYAAIGYRIDKNKNIQVGYLNQYIIKGDGIKAERNHNLQLSFQYNIDIR